MPPKYLENSFLNCSVYLPNVSQNSNALSTRFTILHCHRLRMHRESCLPLYSPASYEIPRNIPLLIVKSAALFPAFYSSFYSFKQYVPYLYSISCDFSEYNLSAIYFFTICTSCFINKGRKTPAIVYVIHQPLSVKSVG